MTWIAGVDGCREGWVVALLDEVSGRLRVRVVRSFQEVLACDEAPALVAVDIPIGLPAGGGGRECDREARALLGGKRGTSVFPAPCRAVLSAGTYDEANQISRTMCGRGLSRQTWAIVPKIRDVDTALTPALQTRVLEVHPEVCFSRMNDDAPVLAAKKSAEGVRRRVDLLIRSGFPEAPDLIADRRPIGAGVDDVLDALAALWSARRAREGSALAVPRDPPTDARGLRMAIWS